MGMGFGHQILNRPIKSDSLEDQSQVLNKLLKALCEIIEKAPYLQQRHDYPEISHALDVSYTSHDI
jgi:hypothetical protein